MSKDKPASRNSFQIESGNNEPKLYAGILCWVKVFSLMGNENSGTLVVEVTKQRNKWRQMKKTNPVAWFWCHVMKYHIFKFWG